MASYVSKYRNATTFKNSTSLVDLENTSRFSPTKISGMAVAAEEFLLGYGEPFEWRDREKHAFDAAVRVLMLRDVVEPTTAFDVKTGEHELEFGPKEKMPEVLNWVKVAASPRRGMRVGRRQRC